GSSSLIGHGRFVAHTDVRGPSFASAGEDGAAAEPRERAFAARVELGAAYTSILRRVVSADDRVIAELDLARSVELASEGYTIHPVLWQLAIEVARALLAERAAGGPTRITAEKVVLVAAARPVARIEARRFADRARVELIDAADTVVAVLEQ